VALAILEDVLDFGPAHLAQAHRRAQAHPLSGEGAEKKFPLASFGRMPYRKFEKALHEAGKLARAVGVQAVSIHDVEQWIVGTEKRGGEDVELDDEADGAPASKRLKKSAA